MALKINSSKGASLVEYALLVSLIAVVCMVAVRQVGQRAECRFNFIADTLANPGLPALYTAACSNVSSGSGY